ncbi:MAG: serine hydrolase [Myxococcota bacterium]|nr:serine hydrolase [Myxococcota bacterium]
MKSPLRLALVSFLCTSGLVFGGALNEQLERSPARELHLPQVARAADLAAGAVHASLMTLRLRPPPPVVAAGITPPALVPDGFLALEPIDLPDARPWTPPPWFPAEEADALWALEGMAGMAVAQETAPRLRSRSAFVYDLDSGQVLMQKAADTRRPVASLTKVVTAITLGAESPDLDAELCMDGSSRPGWPGAVSRIRTGTCTQGWDLLGAALVRSDNGAAMALAEVSGLPYRVFVDRMNEVVSDLGMDQSTFSDPSGVEDDNLSTARDMTRAVVAASAHPVVAPAINAPFWDVTDQTRDRRRRVRTTNKLIARQGSEVLAGKTGYTDTARHCFAGVFRTRDGRRVAITTLGAHRGHQRWSDVRALLRWVEAGAGA